MDGRGEVHGELIFLSVVNTCLSITAFLGNAKILVIRNKELLIRNKGDGYVRYQLGMIRLEDQENRAN